MATKRRGADLLADFLKANAISQQDAAEQLGVFPSSIHYWLKGELTPKGAAILLIEKWSNGAVPASSWLTPEEASDLRKVKPFAVGE